MVYKVKPGQLSYGEAIGIILLENYVPFIPGDVANATSYDYPVRFQRIPGFSVARIMEHDMSLVESLKKGARELETEGVRAITGDCGFMALFQRDIQEAVKIPVFLSSLLQIPFMRMMLSRKGKIGVITANLPSLDDFILRQIGIKDGSDLVMRGLEKSEHFHEAVFNEAGYLDQNRIEKEVVVEAERIVESDPRVEMILLECSLLPPYARAVREATGLPVFDYHTMIDYVYSAVVPRQYNGFM